MVPNITVDDNIRINGNIVTITLSWGEPFYNLDPIVNYTVSCSSDVTCPPIFTTTDNTTRSYIITNLTTMTTYTFSVVATNSIGSGEAGVVMITTPGNYYSSVTTSSEGMTTTTSSEGMTTTTSSSVGMTTTTSSKGMTTSTSSVGMPTTTSSVGMTTTTTSSKGMITSTSSVGMTTTTSSVGMTTTTTSSKDMTTTTSSSVGMTTSTSSEGMTTSTSSVGMTGENMKLRYI